MHEGTVLIKDTLHGLASQHKFYVARNAKYDTGLHLPFRISSTPLTLSEREKDLILKLGPALVAFMQVCDSLYRTESSLQGLLASINMNSTQELSPSQYLFYRPDLLLTTEGFLMCEIETSPFGLGLSHLLNSAYNSEGFKTMVKPEALKNYVSSRFDSGGSIVFSDKTKAYVGQLEYLAENVFSTDQHQWSVKHASQVADENTIYRAHYIHEILHDDAIRSIYTKNQTRDVYPSLTRHMEEKMLLSLLWDERYQSQINQYVSSDKLELLRTIVPYTWVVGHEQYMLPSSRGKKPIKLEDLLSLNRSRRRFVLKVSGFSKDSSWAEGVYFLHKLSKANLAKLIQSVVGRKDCVYIIQEFREGQKEKLEYIGDNGELIKMNGRVRITPYYGAKEGELLTIKATMCEGTERIHASSDSINTAVA